jgi:hypothetical protein
VGLACVSLSLTFEVAGIKFQALRPVVVAKLVGHLTTHPEIKGSNPDTTQHQQKMVNKITISGTPKPNKLQRVLKT